MINKYSMFRNGTIAVVTMFGTAMLFGMENIMLAFPIALISAVFGRQNYGVKTYSKTLRVLIINILIVLTAYVSTLNLYIGIIINFTAIFLIVYTITLPYDATVYKPFVMLYVFAQYANISLERLPLRLLSITFGVLVVLLSNKLINKVNEKTLLGNSITNSLEYIKEGLKKILKGEYSKENEKNCTQIMRELAYKIYVSRYRGYLTTNLGKVQFEIFISIGYLNLYLEKIHEKFNSGNLIENQLEEIIEMVDKIQMVSKGELDISEVETYLEEFRKSILGLSVDGIELYEVLKDIVNGIKALLKLTKKDINKIYDKWERSKHDTISYRFKEYFRFDSIRFKFAMRMAITLTIALFVGELLGFYKVIWAIITIMSVIQPYYEDTLTKSKDRVIGNTIAIIFVGTIITLADSRVVTIGILIISLYLLYGYKEYYKISLFAAVASLCIASLSNDINTMLVYRIVYVIIGVMVALLVNKYLLPYKITDGVVQLQKKIIRYRDTILEQCEFENSKGVDEHIVRDIVINQTLMCQKLHMRNLQYGDEDIDEFIDENTRLVIEKGYKVLSTI